MLLHDLLDATARRLPHKIALVHEKARYTFDHVDTMARRLAATLQGGGCRRGDRVALFLPNGSEMAVSIFATLRAGGAFMPIHAQTKAAKLLYILKDADPVCAIVDTNLATAWSSALPVAGPGLRTVVVAGDDASARPAAAQLQAAMPSARVLTFADALEAGRGDLSDPKTIDMDLAAILYTSGSTGEPKGVMLSHRNMMSAIASVEAYLDFRENDVIMCVLPLSFSYGLYHVFFGFHVGATVIVELSFAFPVKVLETMAHEGVTVFPAVPSIYATLIGLANVSRFDLSKLRILTNAAAPLSLPQIRDIRRLFPQARFFSMYGQTECKRVTYLPPEELDRRPASVGRGMPNQEIYLVDEGGCPLPPDSTGELVVRGSHVMMGYWRQPEATAERLRAGPYPGERVLHTGDIFRMDAEGYLYFSGRKDDIIKSRGEKVSPREVENAIATFAGVQEAAVVGVPDPVLGEAVKAFVVLRPGATVTEREIIKHCLTLLENYMVPKYVDFVASLPLTSTGKVSKAQLKAQT